MTAIAWFTTKRADINRRGFRSCYVIVHLLDKPWKKISRVYVYNKPFVVVYSYFLMFYSTNNF